MANILIVDLMEESAYLLRSLLRGKGFAVSIAISPAEARAKLETGLFDTLVLDLCEVNDEKLSIGRMTNEMLPGLPLVALTSQSEEKNIKGLDLFGKIYRPIQGARVNDVCGRAIKHALALGARRSSNRVTVDLPATFEVGGATYKARITDFSERGLAIDADENIIKDCDLERIEAQAAAGGVQITWTPQKGLNFEAKGRIAFIDRYRRHSGKMIGLILEQIPEEARKYMDSLLKPQAVAA